MDNREFVDQFVSLKTIAQIMEHRSLMERLEQLESEIDAAEKRRVNMIDSIEDSGKRKLLNRSNLHLRADYSRFEDPKIIDKFVEYREELIERLEAYDNPTISVGYQDIWDAYDSIYQKNKSRFRGRPSEENYANEVYVALVEWNDYYSPSEFRWWNRMESVSCDRKNINELTERTRVLLSKVDQTSLFRICVVLFDNKGRQIREAATVWETDNQQLQEKRKAFLMAKNL